MTKARFEASMSLKVFLPQDVVDTWITTDRVELVGEIMTFRADALALRLVPAYFFARLSGGADDGHRLLGRAKMKAAVAALGAEVYMNSVLLGDTAYDVESGFIAKPLDAAQTQDRVVAALAKAGF
jgi:predicted N-acetyltransferase YhbS